MERTMKYPIGIQDFGEVIRGGYVYVDKTALIWRLIAEGKYYFLSRPRRFGKSLLLSTIAAYFSGQPDLFKGLAIATQTDTWPDEHPVLYLDLGGMTYRKPDDLTEVLESHFDVWEELYGADTTRRGVERRFWRIIRRACEHTRRQVVVLIDEYDKPLLEAMNDEPLREAYRATLRGVYGNLKTSDGFIRFAMLTGVTKFGKLSLFSDLNNLNDISMSRRFAAICGITEEEMDRHFGDGIEKLAQENATSREEVKRRLQRQYDGYQFVPKTERLYNPFSLLKALQEGDFKDYWFETGTPDFLAEMVKRENISIENIPREPVEADDFNALDTLENTALPILYQSGYLTIDHRDEDGAYYLRFPNEEVERGFLKHLLSLQVGKRRQLVGSLLLRMAGHVRQGRPEDFMRELQALLADVPYEKGPADEYYFRNLLYVIFRMLSFSCEVEHAMAGGRSDVVIRTDDYIYVLELKVDESAEAALRQIEAKGYAAPYATDKRKLFKIGVNFGGKTKRIDEWQVAEV